MTIIYCFEGVCVFCWIVSYILIIKKSLKDKSYGMPLIAITLNISWEFLFSFVYNPYKYSMQNIGIIIWFLLDVVILYSFLKYGYKYLKNDYSLSKKSFYIVTIITLMLSLLLIYIAVPVFATLYNGDVLLAGEFIANCQNAIISILFVCMILKRKNLDGQSMNIAIYKWIGSLFAGLIKILGLQDTNALELFFIFIIQLFDIVYIMLVKKHYSDNDKN